MMLTVLTGEWYSDAARGLYWEAVCVEAPDVIGVGDTEALAIADWNERIENFMAEIVFH